MNVYTTHSGDIFYCYLITIGFVDIIHGCSIIQIHHTQETQDYIDDEKYGILLIKMSTYYLRSFEGFIQLLVYHSQRLEIYGCLHILDNHSMNYHQSHNIQHHIM